MNKKSEEYKLMKRKEILDCAKKIVIKKGYRFTNIEDITNEVGMSKGSFYSYFSGKNQMVIEILNEIDMEIQRKFQEIKSLDLNLEEFITKLFIAMFFDEEKSKEIFMFFLNILEAIDEISLELKQKIYQIKKNDVGQWEFIFEKYSSDINYPKEDYQKLAEYVIGLETAFIKRKFSNEIFEMFSKRCEGLEIKTSNVGEIQSETDFLIGLILTILYKK